MHAICATSETIETLLCLIKLPVDEKKVVEMIECLLGKSYWNTIYLYLIWIKSKLGSGDHRRLSREIGVRMLEGIKSMPRERRAPICELVEWQASDLVNL